MANPLTLMMPVVPGTDLDKLAGTLAHFQQDIDSALSSIGTVHYARFLVLDRTTANLQPAGDTSELVLAVITEYDGDFDAYIGDFVDQIGAVFDALLQVVVGGKEVTPVGDNLNAFQAFVKANDLSQQPPNDGALYQAYPATVQQILASS
jgi:hypothetical protein